MFTSKALLSGISLALAVAYSPVAMAQGHIAEDEPVVTGITGDTSDDVLARYTDGGTTWISIEEQKGVAERIPTETTKDKFRAAHRMSPEAEAAIVHQVPPVSVVVDGVLYQPEEIHLFHGKQLGFTVGNDGQLFAFTQFSELEKFLESQKLALLTIPPPENSIFYEDWYYSGQHQLEVPPGVMIHYLSSYGMNDMISSMKMSSYATNAYTLFEHDNPQGNYFATGGGSNWPVLFHG